MAYLAFWTNQQHQRLTASARTRVGCFIALLLGGPLISFAAESPTPVQPPPAPLIRFAAVVQFVKGQALSVSVQKTQTPLMFKSVVYENERITSQQGGLVKLMTRQDCRAVIYGNSIALTPYREQPWRVKPEGLRWICQEKNRETVLIRMAGNIETRLTVIGGEFLIDASRLIVLKGQVRGSFKNSGEQDLPLLTFLELKKSDQGTSWQPSAEGTDPDLLKTFNQRYPPPLESSVLESRPESMFSRSASPNRAPKPKSFRLILGPAGGSLVQRYDNTKLDQSAQEGGGPRLIGHQIVGRGALISALSFQEWNPRNQQQTPMNTSPPDGVWTRMKRFSLELGHRLEMNRWWSPYWKAGLASDSARVTVNEYQSGSGGSETVYEFYMLTASAGLDALYSPRWLPFVGLYAALELSASQSLGRGAREAIRDNYFSGGSTKSEANQEPWRMTTFGGLIMLGVSAEY